MVFVTICWLLVGVFLLKLNEEEMKHGGPINKFLAGLIIVVFAPLFIGVNILEIILGLLIGSEDDDC